MPQSERGGKNATSYDVLDKHRRSGYLIGTECHILNDDSMRSLLVATSVARANMSTSMLQKLKMKPKHRCTASETISKYAKKHPFKKALSLLISLRIFG